MSLVAQGLGIDGYGTGGGGTYEGITMTLADEAPVATVDDSQHVAVLAPDNIVVEVEDV